MSRFTIADARILTLAGADEPRRGDSMRDLGVIEHGWLTFEDNRIVGLGEGDPPESESDVLGVAGSVLMPAFVDCHTHTCWAGQRFDEFEMKLAGASYLDILNAGGGIMSTVRAVRETSEEELIDLLLRRLGGMASLGSGVVEIKSGYGLDTANELKMLRAIHGASTQTAQTLIGTFLGAHAIDPDNPHFIDETIEETLPQVVTEFPGIICDAYCEEGAWSLKDTQRLFEKAKELGCRLRVHADQFNSLGATKLAIEMEAISVDHLEATTSEDLQALAKSSTMGVALPICGFQLDDRYARGREFIDQGGALAIASNYNPGSAPSPSMPFTIALACKKLRLTHEEAITASTWNGACVLGLQDQFGSLEVGKRADLQVLDCRDEREIAYEFATAGPLLVILNGHVVHLRALDLDLEASDEEHEEEE
ncbi:MAG: imidazolonepropionase [Planctomycetota bacterium]|nr:imidazolonepropionase [Planctomycetota bacterium]